MTTKRTPDWRLTLPRWIADEIQDARAPDVIEALTAHVALSDDHPDVGAVALSLIEQEAEAWLAWSYDAALTLSLGNLCPLRPDEEPAKITVGRVPPDVRDAIQARAEALGLRHTVYAAGVIARAERPYRMREKKAT